MGRYITSDPIGLEGGLNTYGYGLQNPLFWYDEMGLLSRSETRSNQRKRNAAPLPLPHNSPPRGRNRGGINQRRNLPAFPGTCVEGCQSFLSACQLGASAGPLAVAIPLEVGCVGTGLGALVCMGSVNTLQGLSSAYLLSACDSAYNACLSKCNENGSCR